MITIVLWISIFYTFFFFTVCIVGLPRFLSNVYWRWWRPRQPWAIAQAQMHTTPHGANTNINWKTCIMHGPSEVCGCGVCFATIVFGYLDEFDGAGAAYWFMSTIWWFRKRSVRIYLQWKERQYIYLSMKGFIPFRNSHRNSFRRIQND